jgi:hypothetical protein
MSSVCAPRRLLSLPAAIVGMAGMFMMAGTQSTSQIQQIQGLRMVADADGNEGQVPECPICTDPLDPADSDNPIFLLHQDKAPQNHHHAFHAACIHKWIQQKKSECPMCKGTILEGEKKSAGALAESVLEAQRLQEVREAEQRNYEGLLPGLKDLEKKEKNKMHTRAWNRFYNHNNPKPGETPREEYMRNGGRDRHPVAHLLAGGRPSSPEERRQDAEDRRARAKLHAEYAISLGFREWGLGDPKHPEGRHPASRVGFARAEMDKELYTEEKARLDASISLRKESSDPVEKRASAYARSILGTDELVLMYACL